VSGFAVSSKYVVVKPKKESWVLGCSGITQILIEREISARERERERERLS
jgi:hypothetical protein